MDRAGKGLTIGLVIYSLIFIIILATNAFNILLGLAIEIVLLIILIKRVIGYSLEDVGLIKEVDLKNDLLVPLSIVGLIIIAILISNGFNIIILYSPLEYLILLAYYILYVGLLEELLFRGLIYTSLEEKYNTRTAVILSSVLFSIIHINNLFFPLVWGFISATYRKKYRSIVGLILAHGLIDTIGRLINSATISIPLYIILLLIICTVLSLFFYRSEEVNR